MEIIIEKSYLRIHTSGKVHMMQIYFQQYTKHNDMIKKC